MNAKKALAMGILFLFALVRPPLSAGSDLETLIKEMVLLPSVTGNEELLAAKIRNLLPKALAVEIDNLGSVYAKTGIGEGSLAILAPLDEFGWFVSAITPEGFLRLDRAALPPHPLFDSFLLGHSVVISTSSGLQNGVVAQPAMHLLTRERREELSRGISLDLVYLDIGARSESEVRARGIEHLDPVSFKPELAVLANDQWAGPSLGQKALCAALLTAAEKADSSKSHTPVQFVWMAQTRFLTRGASGRFAQGAARAQTRLKSGAVLVLDILPADRSENGPFIGQGAVLWKIGDEQSHLWDSLEGLSKEADIKLQHQKGGESVLMAPFLAQKIDVISLALPVKFSQTPSEVISLKDVRSLSRLIVEALKEAR